MTTEWNFNYIGTGKKVILKPGKYKLECWGASGGGRFDEWTECAKGGYSKGELTLKKETILYVYAGESGYKKFSNISDWAGFNGGGRGPNEGVDPKFTTCGGGATDIRLIGGVWNDEQGLLSRIIVAGGGGSIGISSFSSIGLGGGFAGGMGVSAGTTCTGGTQYEGGVTVNSNGNGSFGKGGIGNVCAGGGGWYGGAGASTSGVGGGGSGYVLTKDSYKPKGYIPTSEYWLENVNSIAGDNTSNAHGYAKITLLQALPFLNISSYNSSTATFKADHTDPTLLTKIEYFIDDVLKETITTDLTLEKTINYTLEDNALHTLKIVVTDSANATVEKVVSVSRGIAPLPSGSTTDEVTNKWIEIKDTFKSGKTSIINTLALKNIEASLNNTLVELSEKIKTSFDSSDASVEELQNRITELTNQLSQRIKYATGTYTPPDGSQNSLIVPTKLNFVPKTIIISYISFRDTSQPFKYLHAYPCMSGRDRNLKYDNGSYTRIVGTANVRDITADSFNIEIGISDLSAGIKFPISFYTSTFRWYALDIELLNN
ncbi:glycine rich domain-containing protein [Clostridioides difficile]|uniref:glycine rich domain-containing protein n=3 Tax=Clostridioides difficile TaxID=1496 RepID=UPI00038D1C7E|nr:glycine rich domain-containing protein [Clostridioides difficile]EQE56569.1 glycine rich family protein [Clostridioides difficile CD42]EQF30605.1 glycine rich family protein [Clostridioides difficile CD165]EQG13465.1 glycine rich family protein [Clostridioides difficile DA00044]EQG67215.1 glycine rich family protein [Clostridioides difficile DA00160]EQG69152.1 glycine rich family protein [Clostridioides difficile DA00154]